jgi:hypothetical protein
MEIGKPKRTITVEPLRDPLPREQPRKVPERPPRQPRRRRVETPAR